MGSSDSDGSKKTTSNRQTGDGCRKSRRVAGGEADATATSGKSSRFEGWVGVYSCWEEKLDETGA